MGLLAVAVLVAAVRVGRLGLESVRRQQRPLAGRVLLGVAVVVDGQRHAIRAVPLRHPAQFRQGVRQPSLRLAKLSEEHRVTCSQFEWVRTKW
jgi:hypothetical protein